MFKVRDYVVYPKYGVGKVIKKTEEKVGKKERKYYKIEFLNSPLTISVPINQSDELGLRYPLSKYSLRKELKKLRRTVKITKSTLKTLDFFAREKLNSGTVEDAIKLVNLLKSISDKKEKENKNFSYSATQRLEIAVNFLKSEIEHVLGTKAISHYDLN